MCKWQEIEGHKPSLVVGGVYSPEGCIYFVALRCTLVFTLYTEYLQHILFNARMYVMFYCMELVVQKEHLNNKDVHV